MQESGVLLKEHSLETTDCSRTKQRNSSIQLQRTPAKQTDLCEDQSETLLNVFRDSSTGSSFHSQASDFNEPNHNPPWIKPLESSKQLLSSIPVKTDLKKAFKCLQKQNAALTAQLSQQSNELARKECELEQFSEALEGLQNERYLDTIAHEEQLHGRQAKFLIQITELHSSNSALEALHKRDQAELEYFRAALASSTTASLSCSLQETERKLKRTQHKARKQAKLLKCSQQVREDNVRIFSLHSDTLVTLKFRVEKLYKQLVLEMSKSYNTHGSVHSFGLTELEHGLNEVLALLYEKIEHILGEGPRANTDEQGLSRQLHRQATLHIRGSNLT